MAASRTVALRAALSRKLHTPTHHTSKARKACRVGLVSAAVVSLAALVAAQLPASALTVKQTPTAVSGNATWFYALGAPYGGCGLPQEQLDSQNFVALNVYDLPGDYSTFYNRPMDASLADKMGMWDNGHNCGRWVQVTIGDYCTGDNDGAMNKPFCRNGEWTADKYNGATLNMIVGDSCGDGNAWCRDDPYHLDLAKDALNKFVKDGAPVGDMDPDHWNNRHISWKFIEAPDYTGDIKIGFLQSAMRYWAAISVSHLPNGLHGVEYYQDGTWKSAKMNGDMGQAYIISGTVEGGTRFQIRIRDVDDKLLNDGRVYTFGFPESCSGTCNGAYTKVDYTTSKTPEEASSSSSSGGSTPAGTCTATYRTTGSWPTGSMAEVTVTAGDTNLDGWSVSWSVGAGQTVRDAWNGLLTTDGSTATVRSASWNSTLAAHASATFGLTIDGSPDTPVLACQAS